LKFVLLNCLKNVNLSKFKPKRRRLNEGDTTSCRLLKWLI
jgi:hypothetical protein